MSGEGSASAEEALRAALAGVSEDRLRTIVSAALVGEGFVRLSAGPVGSLVAERVEVRHGQPPTRRRWIVRVISREMSEPNLVAEVRLAETDLHACVAQEILFWFQGAVPGLMDRINDRLPRGLSVKTRSGDALLALLRRSGALRRSTLRLNEAESQRYVGWRVLFLHDGSPFDYQLLRRLENRGATVFGANLSARAAAMEGVGDLFGLSFDLVAAFIGDVAGSPLAPAAIEGLRAHLDRGADVVWNAWVAWAARFGAQMPLRDLLPVEIRSEAGSDPLSALREGQEMRIASIATGHQALRHVDVQVPFSLLNTFEPLRVAPGAVALVADVDDTPLLACGLRGRKAGRSVYVNASSHSCATLAIKYSPLDESPELSVLVDSTLDWLYRTRREPTAG